MRRFIRFAPLFLAACGGPAEDVAKSQQKSEPAAAEVEITAPFVATPEVPSDATKSLPVENGVYVIAGSICANPANAAFRIYDGTGISGSATRDCRLEQTRREGDRYSFDQNCVDTYSGERTVWPIEVTVTGPESFMLKDGDEASSFTWCAPGTAPDYLEDLAG